MWPLAVIALLGIGFVAYQRHKVISLPPITPARVYNVTYQWKGAASDLTTANLLGTLGPLGLIPLGSMSLTRGQVVSLPTILAGAFLDTPLIHWTSAQDVGPAPTIGA